MDSRVDRPLTAVRQPFLLSGTHRNQRGVHVRTALPGRKGTKMKVLFAVRNAVFAQKSLKASVWYLWY
jgi:hypothetical protein